MSDTKWKLPFIKDEPEGDESLTSDERLIHVFGKTLEQREKDLVEALELLQRSMDDFKLLNPNDYPQAVKEIETFLNKFK